MGTVKHIANVYSGAFAINNSEQNQAGAFGDIAAAVVKASVPVPLTKMNSQKTDGPGDGVQDALNTLNALYNRAARVHSLGEQAETVSNNIYDDVHVRLSTPVGRVTLNAQETAYDLAKCSRNVHVNYAYKFTEADLPKLQQYIKFYEPQVVALETQARAAKLLVDETPMPLERVFSVEPEGDSFPMPQEFARESTTLADPRLSNAQVGEYVRTVPGAQSQQTPARRNSGAVTRNTIEVNNGSAPAPTEQLPNNLVVTPGGGDPVVGEGGGSDITLTSGGGGVVMGLISLYGIASWWFGETASIQDEQNYTIQTDPDGLDVDVKIKDIRYFDEKGARVSSKYGVRIEVDAVALQPSGFQKDGVTPIYKHYTASFTKQELRPGSMLRFSSGA